MGSASLVDCLDTVLLPSFVAYALTVFLAVYWSVLVSVFVSLLVSVPVALAVVDGSISL